MCIIASSQAGWSISVPWGVGLDVFLVACNSVECERRKKGLYFAILSGLIARGANSLSG